MTLEVPKTLNQWVSDGGNLWAVPFAPEGVAPEIVESVKEAITDYYGERRIGVMSDSRFQSLWNTYLRRYYYPFWQMMESEQAFVTVNEMLQTMKRTSDETLSIVADQKTTENTNGNTTTTGTVNTDTTSSGDSTTDYGRTDTTDTTTTNTVQKSEKGRALQSDMPQSNVASSTAGLDTPVTWTYATGLSDSMSEGTDTTNGTVKNTATAGGSDTTNTSGTSSVDTTTDMKNTTSGDRTASYTSDDTHTRNVTETLEGNPYSTAFRKWKEYLYELPSSLSWLLDKLSPLFYAFYD